MATVAVTFCRVSGYADYGYPSPAAKGASGRSEVLQSGSVSKATAISAEAGNDSAFAIVTALNGNVWVVTGETPVAVPPSAGALTQPGFPVLSGQALPLALAKGEKVAVIDWAG